MTDADALLAAILANPADDTARLVYADCLEEQGQRERAEFIRVQVDESHFVIDYNSAATMHPLTPARERICRLLRRNGHEWLGEFYERCNGRDWIWHRGFISSARLPWDDWRTHAAAILAAQPIDRVTLTTTPDDDECIAHGAAVQNRRIERLPSAWTFKTWPRITFSLPSDAAVAG